MTMTKSKLPTIPVEQIAGSIVVLRGQKVLLDADLARLYGVTTKRFNEQVQRNLHRFPEDFMFQVTDSVEVAFCDLKWKARRTPLFAVCIH